MRLRIHWPVFHYSRCRVFTKVVVIAQIMLRSDRPGTKTPTTVRADIFKNMLYTIPAKGALIRTDHRLRGIGRQRLVAVFTGWSEFEHNIFSNHVTFKRTGAKKRARSARFGAQSGAPCYE